jgi:hypothetical protein
MEISLRIDKNELDASLLEKIKALTKTRIIEIRISDELDETSYLMSTSANRRSLAKSLRELENNEIISKTPEELGL